MYKTHTCGELRPEHIGQTVTLAGWVNARRDHGGLIFLDLRDRWGLTQVVTNPELSPQAHENAAHVRNEFVLKVTGVVRARLAGKENPKLDTGAIEVEVQSLEVLNPSKAPPFLINEEQAVDENVRLKYRYLDLRRERMRRNLELRYQVVKFIRDYLHRAALHRDRDADPVQNHAGRRPRLPGALAACIPARSTPCRSRPSSSNNC